MCGTCGKCRRREYMREYNRRYRAQGRVPEEQYEKARERSRQWYRKHPGASAEAARRHRERHPEKVAARLALNSAIRRGELERGTCETCGSTRVEGHHEDYNKPLDVRWFCPVHHGQEHRVAEAA